MDHRSFPKGSSTPPLRRASRHEVVVASLLRPNRIRVVKFHADRGESEP